ncbi:MAG: hypothetical protein H0W12_00635 [Chitinophagaceae bacterium]|nr:hypothetical protein [Chitinophagaceae bacterium]
MKNFLFSILFFVVCMLTAYLSNAQTRVDPAASDDDADIPSFIKNKPAKDAYLKAREDNINTIRGLPWTLPYNPRVKAINEMKIQEQKNALNRSFLVQSPSWVELGPSPIPNGQTQGVVNAVSGRTVCIAIHPTNPSMVYVGTANGGIYRTVDGGTNWTQIFDGGQSLSIGALAISPSNPSTLFVGTGEADLSADSYAGVGLYRIDNADVAPTLVGPINPLVTTGIANTSAFSARAISKILVDPANGNNIYVSTTSAQIGNPGGAPSGTIPIIALKGIYRSTNALSTLGSIAFTKLTVTATGSVAPDVTGNTNVTDMVMEPGNPDNITCWVYGFTSEGGIWHTTNASAITPTFTQTLAIAASIRGSLTIVQQGTGPSSVVLYAATGESASGTSCTTGSGAVRKSRDGGVTWSAKLQGGGGFCGGQCFYDLPIAVSPVDSLTLLLGGSALGTCSSIMKRSTDASATFIDKGNGLHADEHVIAFAPSDATIAYTGNDGGIFKSTTGGTTWNSINTAGFSATQFQSIAVHPTNTSLTIGGTQDNGTNAIKSDNSPFRVDFGDGGYAAIDQNGGAVNATIMYHTYFNQTNNLIGFASTILGETATEGSPSWKLYGCGGTANGITCSDATLFYAPLVLGPGSPVNNVYFGTNKLYRSVDTGIVMTVVSQTMATTISSIAISKQNDNVRIVGLSNGNVFATVTGVSPLIAVTPPIAAARAVGRVAIDPTNADVAYVT